MEQKLQCPEPPPPLVLCFDGSAPVATGAGYWCPAPATLVSAIDSAPMKDVAAEAIGALNKDVDLRMKLVDAYRKCQAPAPESK